MGEIDQDWYRKIVGRHLDYQNRPYTGDIDFDSVNFQELATAFENLDALVNDRKRDYGGVERNKQRLERSLSDLQAKQERGIDSQLSQSKLLLVDLVQSLPDDDSGYEGVVIEITRAIRDKSRDIDEGVRDLLRYRELPGLIQGVEDKLANLPGSPDFDELDQEIHDKFGSILGYIGIKYEDTDVLRIESEQLDELRRLGREYEPTDRKRENKVIIGMNEALEQAYGAEDHLDSIEGEAAYGLAKYILICSKLETKFDEFAKIQETARAVIENNDPLKDNGFAGLYGKGPQYDNDLIKRVKGTAMQLLAASGNIFRSAE
jgi:hypothetical protein